MNHNERLHWLRTQYLELSRERALFWKSARPYQTDWKRGNLYATTLRTITADINNTSAALENERLKRKQGTKWRRAGVYFKRVAAFLVG